MQVIVDIETSQIPDLLNNIEKLYCIAIKVDNEPTKIYTYLYHPDSDGSLLQAYKILQQADIIVGHNIVKFDIPVINKFSGLQLSNTLHDTLLITKLMYSRDELVANDYSIPELPKSLIGSYSLKAFGYRFGLNKIEYEDWSKMSTEMLVYCKRDVDVTHRLYEFLKTNSNFPSDTVLEVETEVARVIGLQEQYGFYFDIDKARELSTQLKWKALNLEMALKKTFKPIFVPDGNVMVPKKSKKVKKYITKVLPSYFNITRDSVENYRLKIMKNGKYKFPPKGLKLMEVPYNIIYEYIEESCPYQKIKLQTLNPNSRSQLAHRLEKMLGKKIEVLTDKGNTVINESVLLDLIEKETNEDND